MRTGQSNQERRQAAVDWDRRHEVVIRQLYLEQGLSQQRVAARLGVSQNRMHKAMILLGIPRRPRKCFGKRNGRYVDGTWHTRNHAKAKP